MFLIDDLLLAPGKGALALFRELARKAQEEWLDDGSIKQELQEIYAMFEAGTLSEQEFERREYQLAERLQQIAAAKFPEMAMQALPPADVTSAPDPSAVPLVGELVPDGPPTAAAVINRPRVELPFASIADALKPLLDMVSANVSRPDATTESAIHVRPLLEEPPVPPAPQPSPAPKSFPAPQPAPVPTSPLPPAASPAAPPAGALTITQIVDSALHGLSMLRLKVSSVTAVARDEAGWRVSAELVERRGVPDSSDLLGVYELRLDHFGNVLQWERTRMRRRCDLGQ